MDRGTRTMIRNIAAAALIIGGMVLCGGEVDPSVTFNNAVFVKLLGLSAFMFGINLANGGDDD